ncbi:MAG: hypothetical protein KDB82_12980, partial [Planctomycetes bacterium]|nr:hypothetical protein [Planctomycetota bacterium]
MRFVWLLVAVLVTLSVAVVSAQDADPAKEPPPDFKLRKIADVKPAKQTWKSREVIRNGGFDYGTAAWAMKGGLQVVAAESGRAGDDKDLGAGVEVTSVFSTSGFLSQMLHLPDKLTAGTLKLDWRLVSKGQNPTLQQLTFAIGSFNQQAQFESATSIESVNANNFPGWEWQKIDHKLSAEEQKSVNAMLGNKRQLVLIASISGDALRLDADNVSLKVDGEFTPPATPTFVAYAETTRVKGPDGGRDLFEVNAASTDGSKRVNMFRTEGLSIASYGLAWRNDGAELCFSSTHEMAYSYFSGNLYALDDKGVRRVTNPPGRDEILKDERKTGKVKIKVRNLLGENVQGSIYIDGARKLGFFGLGPWQSGADETTVEIDDVVDYGDQLQMVVVRVGGKSALSGVTVDVKAGETAEPAGVVSVGATLQDINALAPCYVKDGKRIVFARGSFFTVEAAGGVPEGKTYGSILGSDPALSPVDDTLVYAGINGGLWMLKPGADQGNEIVDGDAMYFAEDPVWFPDASGIVFTGRTTNQTGWSGRNLAAWIAQNKQLV